MNPDRKNGKIKLVNFDWIGIFVELMPNGLYFIVLWIRVNLYSILFAHFWCLRIKIVGVQFVSKCKNYNAASCDMFYNYRIRHF